MLGSWHNHNSILTITVFVAKPRGLISCKGLNVIHNFKDVKQVLFLMNCIEQVLTTTSFEISKHALFSEDGLILKHVDLIWQSIYTAYPIVHVNSSYKQFI